jgi:hypothetical protein
VVGDDRIEALITATLETTPPDAALVDPIDGRASRALHDGISRLVANAWRIRHLDETRQT